MNIYEFELGVQQLNDAAIAQYSEIISLAEELCSQNCMCEHCGKNNHPIVTLEIPEYVTQAKELYKEFLIVHHKVKNLINELEHQNYVCQYCNEDNHRVSIKKESVKELIQKYMDVRKTYNKDFLEWQLKCMERDNKESGVN